MTDLPHWPRDRDGFRLRGLGMTRIETFTDAAFAFAVSLLVISTQAVPTNYERSDFCPVPRAVPILEAMVAFVLADALIEKLGADSMDEMKPRFASLRKATLEDLQMDNVPHVFWE